MSDQVSKADGGAPQDGRVTGQACVMVACALGREAAGTHSEEQLHALDLALDLLCQRVYGTSSVPPAVAAQHDEAGRLLEDVRRRRAAGELPALPKGMAEMPDGEIEPHLRQLRGLHRTRPKWNGPAGPTIPESSGPSCNVSPPSCPACGERGADHLVALVCARCTEPVQELRPGDAIDRESVVTCPYAACGFEGAPALHAPCVGEVPAFVCVDPIATTPAGTTSAEPGAAPVDPAIRAPDHAVVLAAAPELFHLARSATAICAIVFGYVAREELYKEQGYSDMRAYAREKLGVVSESQYKKMSTAANAAWEFFPARATVALVAAAGYARNSADMPPLPDFTTLARLNAAIRATPEAERAHLLDQVAQRKVTTRKLERIARATTPAASPPESTETATPDATPNPSTAVDPAVQGGEDRDVEAAPSEARAEVPDGTAPPCGPDQKPAEVDTVDDLAREVIRAVRAVLDRDLGRFAQYPLASEVQHNLEIRADELMRDYRTYARRQLRRTKGETPLVTRHDVEEAYATLDMGDPPPWPQPVDEQLLREHFRALASAYHPDVHDGNEATRELFESVVAARKTLLAYNEQVAPYQPPSEDDVGGSPAPGSLASGPSARRGRRTKKPASAKDAKAVAPNTPAEADTGKPPASSPAVPAVSAPSKEPCLDSSPSSPKEALPAPFLKYPGGKTKLLSRLIPLVPSRIRTYYEPFVGSGALFFALLREPAGPRFERVVLGDMNEELIVCYRAVRDDVDQVIERLRGYRYDAEQFKATRSADPATLSDVERAARAIYLSRVAANGMWRVNKTGGFNVPLGDYRNPRILREGELRAASTALAGVELVHGDFEATLKGVRKGDFVYADPPYVGSFADYTSAGFPEADHARLAKIAHRLRKQGVEIVLSNSDTPLVRDLYAGFEIHEVTVRRSVAFKPSKRAEAREVIIAAPGTGYKSPHPADPADDPGSAPPRTDVGTSVSSGSAGDPSVKLRLPVLRDELPEVAPANYAATALGAGLLVPPVGIRWVVIEQSTIDYVVNADADTKAIIAGRVLGIIERSAIEWPKAEVLVACADSLRYSELKSLIPALAQAEWIDAVGTFHLDAVVGVAKRGQLTVFGAVAVASGSERLAAAIQGLVVKDTGDEDKSWLETLRDFGGRVLALATRDFSASEFENDSDALVCSGFPKLHLVVGCVYRCQYCFLLGDEQMFRAPAFTRAFVNVEDAVGVLEAAELQAQRAGRKARVNMGELTDTAALEPILQLLPPLFEPLKRLRHVELAFVSKSGNSCPPVPLEVRGRVFDYRSVSCEPEFEGKTADPMKRLDALGVSRVNGAVPCVRLDPLGPAVLRSLDDVAALQPVIAHMMEVAQPELVVLGTPRFARRLLHVPDRGMGSYIGRVEEAVGVETKDWDCCGPKVRPPEPLRIETYLRVMDLVRAEAERLGVPSPNFWVCKESPAVLAALGMPPSGCCYSPQAA